MMSTLAIFLIYGLGMDIIPIMLVLGVAMVLAMFIQLLLGFFSACILSLGPAAIYPISFG